MINRQTAEATLRSYSSFTSEFRKKVPKTQETPFNPATIAKELRNLDRLWRRFHKAGGSTL